MKPTVGRIVHYRSHPSPDVFCTAAIVTGVSADRQTIDLTVFPRFPESPQSVMEVPQDSTVGRSWHWPEREE